MSYITTVDAAERRAVRLPDGQIGTLIGVTINTRRATVLIHGRRHVRLPARDLELVEPS